MSHSIVPHEMRSIAEPVRWLTTLPFRLFFIVYVIVPETFMFLVDTIEVFFKLLFQTVDLSDFAEDDPGKGKDTETDKAE